MIDSCQRRQAEMARCQARVDELRKHIEGAAP
jgi:hypothetical protein